MTVLQFNPSSVPADDDDTEEFDTVPPTAAIEYPCRKCGREAGPYGGRGRRPTLCTSCKPARVTSKPRVTGNASNLAAQAAAVLAQGNSLMAVLVSALGLFQTGGAIVAANEGFQTQAYEALLLDPELCRTILKAGGKSAGLGIMMAYAGMGVSVVPTAVMELREKKAAKESEDDPRE